MAEPTYSEVKQIISDLPQTYCPAILRHLVETCIAKQVFKPNQIADFVARVEKYHLENPKEPNGNG